MGRRKHTRQDAILDLKRIREHLGRFPSKREYDKIAYKLYLTCCARTVINLFDTWSEAIETVDNLYFKSNNGQVSNNNQDEIPEQGETSANASQEGEG